MYIFSTYFLVWCWVIEDVVDTGHLSKYRPITQRVADCCQPRCEVAQDTSEDLVVGWEHEEDSVQVKENCPYSNEVVELDARKFDQPGNEESIIKAVQYSHVS